MDALIQFYKNKYSPAELVEHLETCGMNMEDLLFILEDWIEENLDLLKDDVEELYGYDSVATS